MGWEVPEILAFDDAPESRLPACDEIRVAELRSCSLLFCADQTYSVLSWGPDRNRVDTQDPIVTNKRRPFVIRVLMRSVTRVLFGC